jgi:hypothetical protein
MSRTPVASAFDRFGRLLVVCDDGTAWGLHVHNQQRWHQLGKSRIGSRPVGAAVDKKTEDHLHVVCADGSIWTLHLDSGDWAREAPVPGSTMDSDPSH